MAQVQTAELETRHVATVLMGVSGRPFIMCRHFTPAGASSDVPLEYSHRRIVDLLAAGYEISDPDGLITCHCGALMTWGQMECDACSEDAANRRDNRQMYNDLRGGM